MTQLTKPDSEPREKEGVNRKLNQFMFPREDSRGPQEGEWLEDAIERAQAQLASIRFHRP